MKVRVIFCVEAPLKKKRGPIDEVNLESPVVEFPGLPTKRLMVIAVPGDDYREVEEVYYNAAVPGEAVRVYLKYAKGEDGEFMKTLGWKEAE